jgi:hypothetical protein
VLSKLERFSDAARFVYVLAANAKVGGGGGLNLVTRWNEVCSGAGLGNLAPRLRGVVFISKAAFIGSIKGHQFLNV